MSSIGHLDIKSNNLGRAREFYEKVLGVSFFEVSEGYIRATMDNKPDIGLSQVDKIATGETFCPYLEVSDLSAAIENVKAYNGEIIGESWKIEERKVEMIKVKDSEGNIIGLFRYY